MSYVLTQPELTTAEMALRLGLAGVLGAAVGFERERRERAAGLRTHMLVSIGAAAITIMSAYGFADYFAHLHVPDGIAPTPRDPGRVAAQIVSGIGFLGGGVILRSGLNVKGLTTAASIWAMGAIGMAAGSGMYTLAWLTTVAILLALIVFRYVNIVVHDRYHHDSIRLSVRVTSDAILDSVMSHVEEESVTVSSMTVESAGMDTEDELVIFDATLRPGITGLSITQAIARMKGVSEVHVRNIRDEA
jgi:putative Mg2+ transporter-C (MgtC) family protein